MNATDSQPIGRLAADTVEIAFLSVTIVLGTLLNSIIFVQLVRHSRTPTAKTSFSSGPYQINSFTLFKLNLCVTDFAILLVHALGKVVWLLTYEWPFGMASCKIYQLLSAFTYYSNTNVVVAIGFDRLKVVYTSHIQGATSVRRVRCMLLFAWILAALCSAPQFYVWTTVEVRSNWTQCSTIWEIAVFEGRSSPSFERLQVVYELMHQAFVFWVPSLMLFFSYLLIMLRIVHHNLRPSYEPCKQPHPSTATLRTRKSSPDKAELVAVDVEECSMCCGRPFRVRHSAVDKCDSTTSDETSFNIPKRSTCLFDLGKQHGSVAKTRRYDVGLRHLPVWRRQLRSRVFLISLTVVAAHVTLWLPYNIISTSRFIRKDLFVWASNHGGPLLEDLIIINSLINPIIYGCDS